MTNPAPAPEPTPDDTQAKFNVLFENAVKAYVEKNKPEPTKTKQPESFFDQLFRS